MGLVNAVVPLARLEEETVQWCREMLANSPMALRCLKAALQRRHRRAGRPAGARRQRDAALLHDRRRRRRGATRSSRSARRTSRASRGCREPLVRVMDCWCRRMPMTEVVPTSRAPATPFAWLLAVRPATLTAALVPVLVGSALAARAGGFRLVAGRGGAGSARCCIQIGANLANDVDDFERGADDRVRGAGRRA